VKHGVKVGERLSVGAFPGRRDEIAHFGGASAADCPERGARRPLSAFA